MTFSKTIVALAAGSLLASVSPVLAQHRGGGNRGRASAGQSAPSGGSARGSSGPTRSSPARPVLRQPTIVFVRLPPIRLRFVSRRLFVWCSDLRRRIAWRGGDQGRALDWSARVRLVGTLLSAVLHVPSPREPRVRFVGRLPGRLSVLLRRPVLLHTVRISRPLRVPVSVSAGLSGVSLDVPAISSGVPVAISVELSAAAAPVKLPVAYPSNSPSQYPSNYPPQSSSRSPQYPSESGSVRVQPGQRSTNVGGVSFEITPDTAEVFVDGSYVGTAREFTPSTRPLDLSAGHHRIEIRSRGYRTLTLEENIVAGQVLPFQGTMEQ